MVAHERKYFLDWLRVIAFGLLILFHVGLLYASWPYNLKSPRIFPEVEWVMIALNPWRLALLFFISGVASRFLMTKLTPGAFTLDRLKRLLPVILFGMFVVNPPQTYVELYSKGIIEFGFVQFWLEHYIVADQSLGLILPRWDHLWFLLYLLLYTLLLGGLYIMGKSVFKTLNAQALPLWCLTVTPAFWLGGTNIMVELLNPQTHAFFDDWAAHVRWAGLFAVGVICAFRTEFWAHAKRIRGNALFASIPLLILMWASRYAALIDPSDSRWADIFYEATKGFYGWAVILALSGYAAQYLNRPSKILAYLTVAVLPIYVLHQPILLIASYYVFPLSTSVWLEAFLISTITGAGALGVYELLIRRFSTMRFFFGLKRLHPT